MELNRRVMLLREIYCIRRDWPIHRLVRPYQRHLRASISWTDVCTRRQEILRKWTNRIKISLGTVEKGRIVRIMNRRAENKLHYGNMQNIFLKKTLFLIRMFCKQFSNSSQSLRSQVNRKRSTLVSINFSHLYFEIMLY